MKPRILLLFDYDWDASGLAALSDQYEFDHAGFDLFSFPSNARLIGFDLDRFVSKLLKRHRQRPYAAVLSNHEQFGALAAALFAEQAGLVGPSPTSIVAAQHKYWMRRALQAVSPESNLQFQLLDCRLGDEPQNVQGFPHFVKPVKAAYSVLARRCNHLEELRALTRFSWHELWVIERLVEPFERVRRRLIPESPPAHRMMLETPWQGEQFNLDGYRFRGKTFPLGIVDEVMYPGTQSFMRFDYPSSLNAQQQAHALEVADKLLNHLGFDNAFFNIEFFYDQKRNQLKLIELNPRLGSQLADLYLRVDGRQVFAMQLALAQGKDPALVPTVSTKHHCAASFVFRKFNGEPSPPPRTQEQLTLLQKAEPDHLLLEFRKSKVGLKREYKWLDSHRYGVLHLSGFDTEDLKRRYLRACASLGWEPGPQWTPPAEVMPEVIT